MFFRISAALGVLVSLCAAGAIPVAAQDVNPPMAPVKFEGGLGSGSPYWFVHFTFAGAGTGVEEVQVRCKEGKELPSSGQEDAKTIVFRLAAPFTVKKEDYGKNDTYLQSGTKDMNRWISVQKYGLVAGKEYSFRAFALNKAGKVVASFTFTGVAIDD